MAAQFAALGAQVVWDDDGAEAELDRIEVAAANWDAVTAMLRLESQWRALLGPGGIVWLGIDYAAAEVVLRIHGYAQPADVLDALRIIEAEALPILNEDHT